MEKTSDVVARRTRRTWAFSEDAERLAQPTILVVEDDRDIRDMVVTFLELAGFAPVGCETAERALNALREQPFDMLVTDYGLPRHSGVWLLQHAEAEGLIDGMRVLIVTAHPYVPGASGYEILRKPFDLDDLVERVRQRTDSYRPARPHTPPSSPCSGDRHNGDESGCPEPVELILYLNARSAESAAAVRNIRRVISRFSPSRVKLTVCEVPGPTLVRRAPGPRTFILGHVTNPALLLEALGDCELDEP